MRGLRLGTGLGLHPGDGDTPRPPPDRSSPPQEQNGEKTNNGIHYRLQLLYSNGGCWGGVQGRVPG